MFSAQFHCHLVCKMESVDKVWVAAALSAKKKKEFVSLPLLRFFSFLQSIEEVDSKTKVNKFRTLKLRSLIRHHQNSCSLDLKNLQRSENENQTYANHYWCHCYYWERKKGPLGQLWLSSKNAIFLEPFSMICFNAIYLSGNVQRNFRHQFHFSSTLPQFR